MTNSMAQNAADYARSNAKVQSAGQCAKYVADALENAGFRFARQSDAYLYHVNGTLKNMGFYQICGGQFKKGDICVTNKAPKHPFGHIAIFDGNNWYSDFIQGSCDVYCDINEKYFYRIGQPIPDNKVWFPAVNGFNQNDPINGYAGSFGKTVTSLRISNGNQYRVHIYGGNWLPAVTGNDQNECCNGYAGTEAGSPIDCVAISGGVRYAAHIQGGNWLPIVNGYDINESNNGYAGIIGKVIDAVMIEGRTYATSYNN